MKVRTVEIERERMCPSPSHNVFKVSDHTEVHGSENELSMYSARDLDIAVDVDMSDGENREQVSCTLYLPPEWL